MTKIRIWFKKLRAYKIVERSYWDFTLVSMATELPQQQGMWLMPIVPRNLHTKDGPNQLLKTNEFHYNGLIHSYITPNDSKVSTGKSLLNTNQISEQ